MNEMLIVVLLIGIISFGVWYLLRYLKPESQAYEKLFGVLLFFSALFFIFTIVDHSTPYFQDIDPFVDSCYSPISYDHSGFIISFHCFSIVSLFILYVNEFELPPMLISIFIVFITIGIFLNGSFLYQISEHDISRIHLWHGAERTQLYLASYPILLTVASIAVLYRIITHRAKLSYKLGYQSTFLNFLNLHLRKLENLPLASILITLPVLLIIVVILILFGQDLESLNRVYTETATWKLSQHIHPPTVDDRHGHYLCTVAAMGSPRLVKPIGIGRRNNAPILINRQLQIANAFEYMVEEISPKAHKVIRSNYDRHGLNLAKSIQSERLSNFTYVLMKPLEWVFLFTLYCFYKSPEKIIRKQYR